MKLLYKEQIDILKKFPKLELSYEKKLHKKVQSDIYLTIPKGKKFFAWFTNYKKYKICFILEINRRFNQIEDIKVFHCSFDKILTSGKGTILYGTIFYVNKNTFFNIENIYYSKGHSLVHYNQYQKFKQISIIVNNYLSQKSYTKNSIIFGLPIMKLIIINLKNIKFTL